MNTSNEFIRNYANEIALEYIKLENTISVAIEEYYNTTQLLGGKKWYCIALENNDVDKEKDRENKRNILLKLVDQIIDFIKTVGKKIAEWYRACKAAIVKFFEKDTIDPKQVVTRFGILVEDLNNDDADLLIGKINQESKIILAELFNKNYSNSFYDFYSNYKKIESKCDSPAKFAENYTFFTDLKDSAAALKVIAKDKKITDNIEQSLKAILNDRHALTNIENMSSVFTEITTLHEKHSVKLESLLNKITRDDLTTMDGDDIEAKQRILINLVSDTLKIDSEVFMKVNHYMQAISTLMSYIVKYRYSKVVYISM